MITMQGTLLSGLLADLLLLYGEAGGEEGAS